MIQDTRKVSEPCFWLRWVAGGVRPTESSKAHVYSVIKRGEVNSHELLRGEIEFISLTGWTSNFVKAESSIECLPQVSSGDSCLPGTDRTVFYTEMSKPKMFSGRVSEVYYLITCRTVGKQSHSFSTLLIQDDRSRSDRLSRRPHFRCINGASFHQEQ